MVSALSYARRTLTGSAAPAAGAAVAAAAAQQALISNYPDSPKVPDALLNLSSAQIALGDNAGAKRTLEDLVNRFPQTDMADKARQRLAKLK